MQTSNILHLLRVQETRLDAKIRRTENNGSADKLMTLEVFGMKLFSKILKGVSNALWITHLLKTSIMIVRTPLTTLKCIPKAIMGHSL